MKTIIFRTVLVMLSLSVGVLSCFASSVDAATTTTTTSTQLTNSVGPQDEPRTDGKTVVWIDYRTDPINRRNSSIYAISLADRKEFLVAPGNFGFENVDVDKDIVVWDQTRNRCPSECTNFEIHAKNLTTNQEFKVGDGRTPSISGNWVVWFGSEGLMARDISTLSTSIILDAKGGGSYHPAIDGTRVVYGATSDKTSSGSPVYNLVTVKIGDNKPPSVLAQVPFSSPSGLYGWDLHGNTVVYSDDTYIHVLSIDNPGSDFKIPFNPFYVQTPTTDGRYIFWSGNSSGLAGYDLSSHSYITMPNSNGSGQPELRNGLLVWSYEASPQPETIQAATISDLLPTARQTQFTSTADRYYFTQTGHTLSYGFKYFWEHSGGLAVFGYPTTEEFQEINSDDNKKYTVQYFERQRYEYHPEFKNTPYETELGRLGVSDAQQRGLLNTFQPLSDNHDPNCVYFPETKHNVCGSFRSYWQSHGLEFGDAGVSFREALALFGYPISEQFKDPNTGLTVQYFERARFEYHPDFVGTANEVELGLLANQLLQSRGWQ